jgi:hypothetical protein
MTLTISPPPPSVARRSAPRGSSPSSRADCVPSRDERHEHGVPGESCVLDRYTDSQGHPREVVARPGRAGSVLVVDRDTAILGDRRLVAHLAADEPAKNARLVCNRYLQDPEGRWCRLVTPEDLERVPFAEDEVEVEATTVPADAGLVDRLGHTYQLELLAGGMSIPQLRWCRQPSNAEPGSPQPVSVREVIACMESYEPVRTLTLNALSLDRREPQGVSTTVLRNELQRVHASRIVLNRGLRESVLAAIERQGLSMSEIAIRCGRVIYDSRGNASGDTSWLARRLGLRPEVGVSIPTPWVHSEVLALIARHGLKISPREVELG